MKRSGASWDDLADAFRRRPVSTALALIVAVALVRIAGEFAVGVLDGLVIGFRDPI